MGDNSGREPPPTRKDRCLMDSGRASVSWIVRWEQQWVETEGEKLFRRASPGMSTSDEDEPSGADQIFWDGHETQQASLNTI